jgi:hypothetical protein
MYYKAFVLLRLPVSVLCLGGFGLLNVWREPGMGFFGFVVVVALLVFSAEHGLYARMGLYCSRGVDCAECALAL